MTDHTNITPENLSAELAQQSNQSDINLAINETAQRVGDVIANQAIGSADFVGIGWLLVAGYVLWRADVRIDVTAGVMVPSVMFLAEYGFMPFADGVIDGMLIGVAAVFGVGIARMLFR